MNRRALSKLLMTALAVFALNGCSSMGSSLSLYDQLGGAGQLSKLAGNMVNSMVSNPDLTGLLGGIDTAGATTKVSDQLCSALGGGCSAPFSADQVASAAGKLNTAQTKAVTDSFNSALDSVTSSSELRKAVSDSVGSKLGGIVGALL